MACVGPRPAGATLPATILLLFCIQTAEALSSVPAATQQHTNPQTPPLPFHLPCSQSPGYCQKVAQKHAHQVQLAAHHCWHHLVSLGHCPQRGPSWKIIPPSLLLKRGRKKTYLPSHKSAVRCRVVAKGTDFGITSETWLCTDLLWKWTYHLIMLSLSFPMCTVGGSDD